MVVMSLVSSPSHTVSLRLGHFSVEVLTEAAGNETERVPGVLARALRLYLNDRGADRAGWEYPEFLREKPAGGEVELRMPVDEDLWLAFEDEATRQGLTASRLAGHAVLYYAAELEAGHIPLRILEEEPG
jgi:hypothetical protein